MYLHKYIMNYDSNFTILMNYIYELVDEKLEEREITVECKDINVWREIAEIVNKDKNVRWYGEMLKYKVVGLEDGIGLEFNFKI